MSNDYKVSLRLKQVEKDILDNCVGYYNNTKGTREITSSEVIRDALKIYENILKQKDDGKLIVAIDPEKVSEHKILIVKEI